MTTSLPGGDWSIIWKAAVANQVAQLNCAASPTPSPCNASTALTSLGTWSTSASLCQMVSINGSSCANGTLSTSALSTSLNVLQILTTEAEVANGTNAINVQSALGITGVTASQLYLTVKQLPQVAYGPVGTTASTAQVQADLQLTLPTVGCDRHPVGGRQRHGDIEDGRLPVQLHGLGEDRRSPRPRTRTRPSPWPVSTSALLTIGGYGPNPQISFSPTNVPPTASTASATPPSNPITVGSPVPSISGLSSSSPAYTVLTTLAGVLGPVLQAAGVAVGGAQVAYLSTNCDAVSLVQ